MLKTQNSPLGKETFYKETYDKSLLYPIPRSENRLNLACDFFGADIWNCYELSWLNGRGKPEIACLELIFPCTTPCLIESKSLKLYFNSFNQTRFYGKEQVLEKIREDLSEASGGKVEVRELTNQHLTTWKGESLDALDVEIEAYSPQPDFLTAQDEFVEEVLTTNLFKSNCPVTGQPDWASVLIHYEGNKIGRKGLLKYLISFREHDAFHEACVERIFYDIQTRCKPKNLTVIARFTRRGGLDINPFRSTLDLDVPNVRLPRQ